MIKKTFLKSIKNWSNQLRKAEGGFTLVDVSIMMAVAGLMAAPMIMQYENWEKAERQAVSNANMTSVDAAVKNYYFENEYYPCPADPTLGPNDAGFGEEMRDPPAVPGTVGNCQIDAADPGDPVLYGAIPFKSLKMTSKEVLDAWGNKLTYAVTQNFTNPATFAGSGQIVIHQDATQNSATTCNGPARDNANIHYVVLSHGETGFGAYNNQGNLVAACQQPSEAKDAENCNNDATFRFSTCTQNRSAGPNFYDDMFLVTNLQRTAVPTRIWDTGNNPNNIGSAGLYLGIGTSAPERPVDVIGNVRAEKLDGDDTKNGLAHASEYCDPSGENCFKPSLISGIDPNMNCSEGTAIRGVGSNKVKCMNALTNMYTQTCPAGYYVSRINPRQLMTYTYDSATRTSTSTAVYDDGNVSIPPEYQPMGGSTGGTSDSDGSGGGGGIYVYTSGSETTYKYFSNGSVQCAKP